MIVLMKGVRRSPVSRSPSISRSHSARSVLLTSPGVADDGLEIRLLQLLEHPVVGVDQMLGEVVPYR